MLFRKNIEPRCVYCAKGNQINDREVACPKKGVVAVGYHCMAFKYDPFKREPPRPVKLETNRLTAEDFSID